MALGQVNSFSYSVPQTRTSHSGNNQEQKKDDTLAQELAQLDKAAQAAQDAFAKRIELIQIKARNNEIVTNLQSQQDEAEKAYQQFLKSKDSKGKARIDTGTKGFSRWMANAGTALVNMGKSIAGYDKDGNWDSKRCIKNVGMTALAIGATFIPYVGPVIGYGLLTAGVLGAGIGIAHGASKLDKAEKSGNQAKIDEAQQDICGNAFIGITSALGLRGIGNAFRTSSATAELASAATARASRAGKCVEAISNFGRDMTVNAFKATKHSAASGVAPSLTKFRSWDKQYKIKNKQMADMFAQKLAKLDEQISAETNFAKRALLQEQKQLLEASYTEFSKIERNIKSKTDFDKLAQNNKPKSNQKYIQNAYTEKSCLPAGKWRMQWFRNVNGTLVKEEEFLLFQNRIMRQQRAIEKELQQLIKAKENMMRTFAKHPKKHRAALDEYISTADIKTSFFKPSTWLKSKEMIAIGGKNPGYTTSLLGSALITPGSNVAKGIGTWIEPIHSGALLFTADLSPEETQAQQDTMQEAIEKISALKDKMINAETIEEYNAAIEEYESLVAAVNGEGTQEQVQTQQ